MHKVRESTIVRPFDHDTSMSEETLLQSVLLISDTKSYMWNRRLPSRCGAARMIRRCDIRGRHHLPLSGNLALQGPILDGYYFFIGVRTPFPFNSPPHSGRRSGQERIMKNSLESQTKIRLVLELF